MGLQDVEVVGQRKLAPGAVHPQHGNHTDFRQCQHHPLAQGIGAANEGAPEGVVHAALAVAEFFGVVAVGVEPGHMAGGGGLCELFAQPTLQGAARECLDFSASGAQRGLPEKQRRFFQAAGVGQRGRGTVRIGEPGVRVGRSIASSTTGSERQRAGCHQRGGRQASHRGGIRTVFGERCGVQGEGGGCCHGDVLQSRGASLACRRAAPAACNNRARGISNCYKRL